jgi:hypothetical protein
VVVVAVHRGTEMVAATVIRHARRLPVPAATIAVGNAVATAIGVRLCDMPIIGEAVAAVIEFSGVRNCWGFSVL